MKTISRVVGARCVVGLLCGVWLSSCSDSGSSAAEGDSGLGVDGGQSTASTTTDESPTDTGDEPTHSDPDTSDVENTEPSEVTTEADSGAEPVESSVGTDSEMETTSTSEDETEPVTSSDPEPTLDPTESSAGDGGTLETTESPSTTADSGAQPVLDASVEDDDLLDSSVVVELDASPDAAPTSDETLTSDDTLAGASVAVAGESVAGESVAAEESVAVLAAGVAVSAAELLAAGVHPTTALGDQQMLGSTRALPMRRSARSCALLPSWTNSTAAGTTPSGSYMVRPGTRTVRPSRWELRGV